MVASAKRLGPQLAPLPNLDVVRATKSEQDQYRYVDPNTILVGDPNETSSAMGRLFSQGEPSAEAKMVERVAAWSDFWVLMDPLSFNHGALAAKLPGVTKLTAGVAMRDGVTVEAWFDTLSPAAAKNLADKLRKDPQGAPIVDQVNGGEVVVEQRGNAVRIYARLAAPGGTTKAAVVPAMAPVSRDKVSEVQVGMERAAVEALLGKAHSETTIQGDGVTATLIYNLAGKGTANVRTVDGKVESVRFFE